MKNINDMTAREFLSEIGTRGGSARTPAKISAARRNGIKGGRPIDPRSARQIKLKKDLTKP